MADNQELQGKVIVITGASSGFGKGAARDFAKAGAHVVLAARRDELLDDLARECETHGVQALAVPTDVSQQADVENLASEALAKFGRIDVWVNNAGVAAIGRFEEVPLEDHAQVIKTDLIGTIYGSHLAFAQFVKQGQGTLINIASGLGKISAPYYGSYAAAKFGIVGLDGTLRQEISLRNLDNVHVCTVMPMAMDTYFFDHAANYTGHEGAPIPPLYDPQMVVDTIVSLASKPHDEVIVGNAGKFMNALHQVASGLVEAVMGKQTHLAQIENAPPHPDTAGALHEPTAEGTTVSAGRKD